MKFSIRRVSSSLAVSFAAALLMLAPTLAAQAQPNSAQSNSAVAPSTNDETHSAPSGADTAKPAAAATTKPASHKAAHPKKKKASFMNKIKDKAKKQAEKLFGSKEEPKQQ